MLSSDPVGPSQVTTLVSINSILFLFTVSVNLFTSSAVLHSKAQFKHCLKLKLYFLYQKYFRLTHLIIDLINFEIISFIEAVKVFTILFYLKFSQ